MFYFEVASEFYYYYFLCSAIGEEEIEYSNLF